jgi:hypothetical protein
VFDFLGEHGPLELMLPQLVGLPREQIDPKVIEHAKFVDPVIVQQIRYWYMEEKRYDGEKVFKYLYRFWKVLKAYQSKREGWSRAKGKRVLETLKSTFGGADPSPALLLVFGR